MKKKSLDLNYKFYIFIATFLVAITFMYLKYKEGLFFISLLLFIAYCYEILVYRKIEWTKYVENLSKDIDIASRDAIRNIPTGAVLIDSRECVIWYNSKFLDISKNKRLESLYCSSA